MFSVCSHLGGGGHSADSAQGGLGQSADLAGGGVSQLTQLGGEGQSAQGGGSVSQGVGQSAKGGSAGEGVSWGGQPGGGPAKIGQQNEYSLHGGRYASCIQAGGLSCLYLVSDIH